MRKGFWRMPPQNYKGLRIDPEILKLIESLNNANFITFVCCAGHYNASGCGKSRGFIGFARTYDKEAILDILKDFGLTDIRIEYMGNYMDTKEAMGKFNESIITFCTFEPVGLPRLSGVGSIRDIGILDQLDLMERQLCFV